MRGGEPEVQSPLVRRSRRECEVGSLSPSVRIWLDDREVTVPADERPTGVLQKTLNYPELCDSSKHDLQKHPELCNSARDDTQKHPELCNTPDTTQKKPELCNSGKMTDPQTLTVTQHDTFAVSEPARAPCGARITHSTTSSKLEPHSSMIFRLLQNRGHSRLCSLPADSWRPHQDRKFMTTGRLSENVASRMR